MSLDRAIVPGLQCGRYTFDFGIACQGARRVIADIECDGYSFHDRTESQAQHDRDRDIYIQERGLVAFRFMGSKIRSAPDECARTIFSSLWRMAARP